MLDLSHLAVRSYGTVLTKRFATLFGDNRPDLATLINQIARVALTRAAGTTALFHDLDHTIAIVEAGQDILRGKIVRDGTVGPDDWAHFLVALLCFNIGFNRNLLPGDEGRRCVVDAAGRSIVLPVGVTDGALWPYFVDRSKLFVRSYFSHHPLLNADRLANYIEYGRFPIPPEQNTDTTSFHGLLRAAHLIGSVGDPDFMHKINPMLIELREAGLTEQFGYHDVESFRANFSIYFRDMLQPVLGEAMRLLELTASGRSWLAGMHAHLLLEQHPQLRDLPA